VKFETREMIDDAMTDFERDVVRALSKHAHKVYMESDTQATKQANRDQQYGPEGPPSALDPMQWAVIDQAAQNYIVEYRRLLVTEGATIINGQQVPWMKDFSTEARLNVTQIIEKGIVSGLAPRKETAAALTKVFDGSRARAARVARTETAVIRGTAKAARWKERNYSFVRITDGRAPGVFPCNCEQYDGQFWTVDYYRTHLIEHPNCTRNASPISSSDIPEGTFIYGLEGSRVPWVSA
jgi:hypothetical protein